MNSTVQNSNLLKTEDKEDILLIIDDEIEVIHTLRRIFHQQYTVEIASNKKDALEILANKNVGVILCDQRMPDMKGTDFFSSIKEVHKDIVKILITGYTSLDDVIEGINKGEVFRYLTKPWNLVDLKNSVEQAFSQLHLIEDNQRMLEELLNINKVLENKVKDRTEEISKQNKELEKLNKKLELLSIQDYLTGLNNTRLLQDIFDDKERTAERLEISLIMILIDLNNFKAVNDQLGHVKGDELLKTFASIMKQNSRENFDAVFRIGGDEFIILMLNCTQEKAEESIKVISSEYSKHTDLSSVAYGIVKIEPKSDLELKEWIDIADKRMYSNKRKSR